MKKFLRTFLVLCLCCSIVFSAAIPRAQAAALTTATVATATAVTAGLIALGIGVGATDAAFNKLVDSLAATAESDTVPVWIQETADGFLTFLTVDFLDGLLTKLFGDGVLTAVPSYGATLSPGSYVTASWYKYSTITRTVTPSQESEFFYITTPSTDYLVVCSKVSALNFFTEDGGGVAFGSDSANVYVDSVSYWAYGANRTEAGSAGSAPVYSFDSNTLLFSSMVKSIYSGDVPGASSAVSTSEDLTLGSVGTSLAAPNYDDWRNNAIPVVPPVVGGGTASEEEDAVPVSFPGLDRPGLTDQTQSGAQAGVTPGTVVDEIVNAGADAGTDTGTIAGVINEIKALPASIAQAIADVFSPPAASEAFQISLTDFFPFCIPFDLYNLLDALAAAPQAPVFNGVIPVPTFGQTYEIEVDLSPWDNVAALFRTLQLGLFIVGLALVTRERFLRS